jgi:hypothetical protein
MNLRNTTLQYCVIPDLIGNPWPEMSCLRNGQAMDSRVRGNDKVLGLKSCSI